MRGSRDRGTVVRSTANGAIRSLRTRDGLSIAQGNLRTSDRADQARLNALLASALRAMEEGGVGGSIAIARPSGRRPLLLVIKHRPSDCPPSHLFGPSALVRIVDPEETASPQPDWAALFAFTPAETLLAAALLNEEESLRQSAGKLGIAYATARVHLANVFDKTGVRTQSQLVRLLSRLGP